MAIPNRIPSTKESNPTPAPLRIYKGSRTSTEGEEGGGESRLRADLDPANISFYDKGTVVGPKSTFQAWTERVRRFFKMH